MLAEFAPAGTGRVLDVTHGGQPLVWLADAERAPRKTEVDRLAGLAALHREERILRRGWGFLAGRTEIEGKPRKVRVPLLSQPVQLERGLTGYRVVPAGDLEITPLLADRLLAAALEAAPGLAAPGWLASTGSRAWLVSAAEATGLSFDAVTETRRPPGDRLVLIASAGLFVVRDVFSAGLGDSLRGWAGRELAGTALAAVYGGDGAERPDEGPVRSPLPLTESQALVVSRARTAAVTVVSGPPGNGKSHTVVAAALEVVHRGGSVLVATQSPHAAEVLAGLLGRYPGPAPVLFGDGARTDLAALLGAGAERGPGERELRAARAAVRLAHDRVRAASATVEQALELERRAASLTEWEPRLAGLAGDVPGAFDDRVDLARVAGLRARDGWWARRRVARLLRAAHGVPERTVTDALEAAAAQRAAGRLAAAGGTDLAPHWAALWLAEDRLAEAVGAEMRDAARSAKRWDSDARRAASALAAALRAGRSKRRELLARIDAAPLVRALPLWIGTVADVEDLLPPAPGMFDLVVIDEASHVDQIRAAPVLARARRALIVGDPRQLRFVSFVSDVDVAGVLDRHGADDRLDVRRVSTYDLAAGSAPATWLAEHHRGTPHLIGFSAHRFYDDRIAVLARDPGLAVEVRAVDGGALVNGVNEAEVKATVELVGELADAGRRGIGVVSPFRPQAEALSAALIAAYPVERIEELRLRVGTVHAFQGSEADVVVASLGLVPGDAAGRRRFVADPHLFNVMITRARSRFVVVTSLPGADGLLGDYFAYATRPAASTAAGTPISPWAAALADELERLSVPVVRGHRVGPWTVDLCVGTGQVGVLGSVLPAGHVSRQRALSRAGWRLLDALPARWSGDVRLAALDIAEQLRTGVDS